MSNLENANIRAPGPTLPPRTWDFFETTLVALIAYGVFMLAGWIAVDFAFNAYGAIEGYSPAELREAWLKYQQDWGGFYYIGGALPGIAVLSTAIHMAGRQFEEYLALKWPAPREAVRAFGIFAIVLAGEELIAYFAGAESCAPTSGLVVGGPSGLMIMLIGSCIAVPVLEEFIVRGFMFRGWSESFLGAGRSHRADIGGVGDESYPIWLAWAIGDFRYGPSAWLFSLAQRFNLVDRDDSFGPQHCCVFHEGTLRLGVT